MDPITPMALMFGATVALALIGLLALFVGRLVAGTATATLGFAAATVIATLGFGPLLAVALLAAAAMCAALLVSALRLAGSLPTIPAPPAADLYDTTERSTR